MRVVDLHAAFGQMPHGTGGLQPLDAVVAEAARFGVALTGASSLRALYYDHTTGNAEAIAAARQHPGLLPVATINPLQVDGDDEADRCLAAGVRLFRFYPTVQHWEVESLAFRRIVRRLGDAGAVVSAYVGDVCTAGRLGAATAGLGAPVAVLGVHYSRFGEAVEALRQFPHLYAESNRLGTAGALEHLVREVGPDRVLFGSGTPKKPLASALGLIWGADLSDDERSAILGGNALRLLGAAGADLSGMVEGRTAAPFPCPVRVFDVRAGLGRQPLPLPELSAAETVQRLGRHGVTRAVVSSQMALRYDVAEGNDQTARAIAEQPPLAGYVVLDPHDVAGSAAELARCFANDRFVGVEINLLLASVPASSAAVRALFAQAASYGKPVLLHAGGADYARAVVEIARAHPALPIILAHAGPGRPEVAAFEAAAQSDNLYLEFSTTYPWRGAVRAAIERVGKTRVLFGSGFPLLDAGYVLGHYQDADLTADEEQAIFWENAARLFPTA